MEKPEQKIETVGTLAEDIMCAGVGDDKPQVSAKKVIVEDIKIEPVNSNGKKIGDKLVLIALHPDLKETIDISSVRYVQKDKIKTSGLWVKLDTENKLFYHSAIASMLRYYLVKSIKDLRGMTLDTVADESGYLAVKAY